MIQHKLKIEERWLDRIKNGQKTCEVRINDRDYQVGDMIVFMTQLQEGEDMAYGQEYVEKDGHTYHVYTTPYRITHVLPCSACNGLMGDYCVLSIKEMSSKSSN